MGFFSSVGGFFDKAGDTLSDVDWGETAETVAGTAEEVGTIIDATQGDDALPPIGPGGGLPPYGGRRRPPLRPDPEPPRDDPEPTPEQPNQSNPLAALTSAGGLAVLGIIGAIIATR
jgi:hypothetical protein